MQPFMVLLLDDKLVARTRKNDGDVLLATLSPSPLARTVLETLIRAASVTHRIVAAARIAVVHSAMGETSPIAAAEVETILRSALELLDSDEALDSSNVAAVLAPREGSP